MTFYPSFKVFPRMVVSEAFKFSIILPGVECKGRMTRHIGQRSSPRYVLFMSFYGDENIAAADTTTIAASYQSPACRRGRDLGSEMWWIEAQIPWTKPVITVHHESDLMVAMSVAGWLRE